MAEKKGEVRKKPSNRMKADRVQVAQEEVTAIQRRIQDDDLWELVLEAVDAMLKAVQKLLDAAMASRSVSVGRNAPTKR